MKVANELDILRAQGIQVNKPLRFRVGLSGQRVYGLLMLLQNRALASENYQDCREAVYFAEEIRGQVTKQGF
jgi:hypothetical protein